MAKEKHYKLNKKDYEKLMKGEEIHFYHGRDIDIYLKLDEEILT